MGGLAQAQPNPAIERTATVKWCGDRQHPLGNDVSLTIDHVDPGGVERPGPSLGNANHPSHSGAVGQQCTPAGESQVFGVDLIVDDVHRGRWGGYAEAEIDHRWQLKTAGNRQGHQARFIHPNPPRSLETLVVFPLTPCPFGTRSTRFWRSAGISERRSTQSTTTCLKA